MATGWIVKNPTKMDEYDEIRRTITIDAWMMNR